MDKQQIISFIQSQLNEGKISREELAAIAGEQKQKGNNTGVPQQLIKPERQSWNIVSTLYTIGTIIVLIGAIILVYQHWDEIGFAGRILVTLGLAFAAYISGIALGKSRMTISQVMFTIAAVLAPLGTYVLLNQFGIPFNSLNEAYAALALLVIFASAQSFVRNNVLVIVLVGYGSWAYYAFLANIFSSNSYSVEWIKWSSIFLGVAYVLISYGYQSMKKGDAGVRSEENQAVSNVLYGLGTLGILGGGISLNGAWDFLYILFIFAGFYGSVYLKSKAMLMFSALFLIGYIIKLTSRYFVDSIGWPVALIVCGFLVVVIGYGTVQINKKYLNQTVA